MRILVTGSEGSLAQMIIPYLLKSGHEIVGYDNFERYGTIRRKRNYEFHRGDICNTETAKKIFKNTSFEAVFHLAALVYGVVGFHQRPADILANNSLMTANLLKYGCEKIGKFVYLSSSMVYEQCLSWPHREADTEKTIVMSTSYGLSKYFGERLVKAFSEQFAIKYVIWRPFNIITPFETAEEEGFSHVFSDMVEKVLVKKENPIPILGDGEQIRCFTNIYDVADALAKFSLDAKAENQTFNIGNPEPINIKTLVNKIVIISKKYKLLPAEYNPSFSYQPIYSDDVRKRIPDISKLQAAFSWEPHIKVDDSLDMYIRHKFKITK